MSHLRQLSTSPLCLSLLLLASGCGQTPAAAPDLSVYCTSDKACSGRTPHCDRPTGRCVACTDDAHCPVPLVCLGGECARGCSVNRGCGDAGICDVDAGVCRSCTADRDCPADSPRCELGTGRCWPCLPAGNGVPDNCPDGKSCALEGQGGAEGYACLAGCKDDAECKKSGPASAACCDHRCVDTASNKGNCGVCGTVCNFPAACCNAACNDFQLDVKHCGSCGVACVLPHAAPVCRGGRCEVDSCELGFGDCNQIGSDGCEANLGSDPRHCGGCGRACVLPNAVPGCANGSCVVSLCKVGFADCDVQPANGCEVDVSSDLMNCGGCNQGCLLAHASGGCLAGRCSITACSGTFFDCDKDARNGCEIDLFNDPASCGACGAVCPKPAHGMAGCSIGSCVVASCDGTFSDCDRQVGNGCEVDLGFDPANCGACGKVCAVPHAVPGCVGGSCSIAMCNGAFADCDRDPVTGCEVDTANDPKSCGACGKVCPAIANGAAGCAVGSCGVGQCNKGFGDCDGNAGNGCEAPVDSDIANCGACKKACAAQQICVGGVCSSRDFGNGRDGPLNLIGGQTLTLGMVRTPASASAGQSVVTVGSANGFAAGQTVMIHQSQGQLAGIWELATVASTGNNQVTLLAPLALPYSSAGNNRAQLLVVPQYSDVTVAGGATLTAAPWDGATGGILVFQASGTLIVNGIVSMDGKGYRGSTHPCLYRCLPGVAGESSAGVGVGSSAANGGGGGGGGAGQDCGMGGGGGYGGSGGNGQNGSVGSCSANPHLGGTGGGVIGAADLSTSLLFGGAGGEGGADEDGARPGAGGNGGGAIVLLAFKMVVNGGATIGGGGVVGGGGEAAGQCGGSGCGMGGGGGGAGGAIRIVSTNAALGVGVINATGAAGGACTCGGYTAGAGGNGRIAVKSPVITGNTTPVYFGG